MRSKKPNSEICLEVHKTRQHMPLTSLIRTLLQDKWKSRWQLFPILTSRSSSRAALSFFRFSMISESAKSSYRSAIQRRKASILKIRDLPRPIHLLLERPGFWTLKVSMVLFKNRQASAMPMKPRTASVSPSIVLIRSWRMLARKGNCLGSSMQILIRLLARIPLTAIFRHWLILPRFRTKLKVKFHAQRMRSSTRRAPKDMSTGRSLSSSISDLKALLLFLTIDLKMF